VLVNVPEPARYAIHKLIVSQVRSDAPKRAKDLWQASCLLAVLLRQDKHALMETFAEAMKRGPKWSQNVRRGLDSVDAGLREEFQTVLDGLGRKLGIEMSF